MLFAAHPIGVFATGIELGAQYRIVTERLLMLAHGFFGNLENTDAFDIGRRAGEMLVDELAGQAHRFENLRTTVTLIGRNTHLRHHLQQAFRYGLDIFLLRFPGVHIRKVVAHVA